MCGIAGIFYYKEPNVEPYGITKGLLTGITHRGPDHEGIYSNSVFSFGMRRLSIIDLQGGNQPISDYDKRYQIIFNGEIYNYQSLKKELQKLGCKFKTKSDTEVILNGYITWGEKVLDRLEGMFAIAIYDEHKHELFLARDRSGKKPLYIYNDDDKLVFCSEVKALSISLSLNEINMQAYWDYLTYRYIPGRNSIFENIFRLDKSTYVLVNKQGNKQEQYWALPNKEDDSVGEHGQYVERFGELFSEAVKKRLVSDVPLGMILSGGVDSCAVLYEASKYKKIDSFHVYFNDKNENYNEYKYAKEISSIVGSNLNVVEMTDKSFIDGLNHMHEWVDEPTGDLSFIPFKSLCDKTREHVKVALSGEGSDEVLGGYDIEYLYRRHCVNSIISSLPKMLQNIAWRALSILFRKDAVNEIKNNKPYYINNHPYTVTFQASELDKNNLLRHEADFRYKESERYLKNHYSECEERDLVNRMLYVLNQDWLVESVLMKSDKVSMSSSLEIRSPFMDHPLNEFLFKIKMKHKIGLSKNGFYGKRLLKDYLNGKLPDKFIHRKKLGFPIPGYMLGSDVYKTFIHDVLNTQNNFYEGIFSKASVNKMIGSVFKKNDSSESNQKNFIWSLVLFELWHRNVVN
jgi:asparagine synthase (glutamine-hydrolysing)